MKHYSSGMHVRLAFSVAAHLDSDLLLVDEVLAVGDAEFQRKCMGKMHDVAGEGRAVVFVSHNLNAVQRLCSRALLIDSGRLQMDGSPGAVCARYLEQWGPEQSGGTATLTESVPRFGTGDARLRRVTLTDVRGRELTAVRFGQPFRVRLLVEASQQIPEAAFEVGICSADGERVATAQSIDRERPPAALPAGRHEVEAELRMTSLPGEYSLTVGVHRRSGITLDYVEHALAFSALNVAESGGDHYPWQGVRGYVRPESAWSAPRAAERGRPDSRGGGFVRRPALRSARPPEPAVRSVARGPQTAVDRYWSGHTVAAKRFATTRASEAFLEWRFDQYPLFREFAGLWGDHDDEVLLDYGCGPGNDLTGFALYTGARRIIGFDVSPRALELAPRPACPPPDRTAAHPAHRGQRRRDRHPLEDEWRRLRAVPRRATPHFGPGGDPA